MSSVRVLEGYRVTLPEDARKKLRIKKGDILSFEIRGREIVLKSDLIPASPTVAMLGLAAGVERTPEQAVQEEVEEKLERSVTIRRRKHIR